MKLLYDFVKGNLSNLLLYPVSQMYLKRKISEKVRKLDETYSIDYEVRKKNNLESLISILQFSQKNVPYYRDLFESIGFVPEKLRDDFSHFYIIPYLTKDIIIEQGGRMLRQDTAGFRRHAFKTGGSTGKSAMIHYDQSALDWSSAVTLYARDVVGHKHWKSEIHFASRFPEKFPLKDRVKEYIKCFIMNRGNIFFDSLDDDSLATIWGELCKAKPHLIHAHPSTIYALALWVKRNGIKERPFKVFESSGELLDKNKRDVIAESLGCKVVDRYGLAEFGVAAYQVHGDADLQVFDSFVFPEDNVFDTETQLSELVLTGLTNYFMPLIRYRTGDRGEVVETNDGLFIHNITGRIHDLVEIHGVPYPTHYIQDVIDRIGGVQEFQILKSDKEKMKLLLVSENSANNTAILKKVNDFWGDSFEVKFIEHAGLLSVGWRDKFRYVVNQ